MTDKELIKTTEDILKESVNEVKDLLHNKPIPLRDTLAIKWYPLSEHEKEIKVLKEYMDNQDLIIYNKEVKIEKLDKINQEFNDLVGNLRKEVKFYEEKIKQLGVSWLDKQFLDAEKVKEIIDNSEFTNIIIQRLSPNQIMDEIKLYLLNRLGG